MGRGRAKAKQQKVARELKYNSQFTDLDALQRELAGSAAASPSTEDDDDDPYDDPYADSEEDADDADDWTSSAR